MIRYITLWLVLLAAAIMNGVLREATFARALPELRAHQLSTAIGAALVGALIWLFGEIWPLASGRDALAIGLIWLGLTVAFEFFMGRVLRQKPVHELLADYDLRAGRVWVLFLAWLTIAPWLFYRLRLARC